MIILEDLTLQFAKEQEIRIHHEGIDVLVKAKGIDPIIDDIVYYPGFYHVNISLKGQYENNVYNVIENAACKLNDIFRSVGIKNFNLKQDNPSKFEKGILTINYHIGFQEHDQELITPLIIKSIKEFKNYINKN